MANSTQIWVQNNATEVINTVSKTQPADGLSNFLGYIVIIAFAGYVLYKLGVFDKFQKGKMQLMKDERKSMIKLILKEYKDYLKSKGVKTKQKLFYGAVPIGAVSKVAEIPYILRWAKSKYGKDGKPVKDKYGKEIKDAVMKEGKFMLVELRKGFVQEHLKIGSSIYLLESSKVVKTEHYILDSSVALERYMGVWVGRGREETLFIEEIAWKLQHELLFSSLPNIAENLIYGNPSVAKDSAVMEKEAELDDRKSERRKRTM